MQEYFENEINLGNWLPSFIVQNIQTPSRPLFLSFNDNVFLQGETTTMRIQAGVTKS